MVVVAGLAAVLMGDGLVVVSMAVVLVLEVEEVEAGRMVFALVVHLVMLPQILCYLVVPSTLCEPVVLL